MTLGRSTDLYKFRALPCEGEYTAWVNDINPFDNEKSSVCVD